MPDDQPVMTALAEITAVSLLHSNLPAREHMIARLAALVAVDAPTASYVMNASTAAQTGITVEDVQGLLVAVAPLVGTARVVTAAERITEALGFIIELAIAELVAEVEAADQPRRTGAEGRRRRRWCVFAVVARGRQARCRPADRQADPVQRKRAPGLWMRGQWADREVDPPRLPTEVKNRAR